MKEIANIIADKTQATKTTIIKRFYFVKKKYIKWIKQTAIAIITKEI